MTDFQLLGEQFRLAREAREMELADIERQTRIRLKFLQAIERGDFELIDSPLQLRGFLRNYAETVGLDVDAVLAHYEEALQHKGRRRPKKTTSPPVAAPAAATAPAPTGRASDVPSSKISIASSKSLSSSTTSQFVPSRRRNFLRTVVAVTLAALLTGAIVVGSLLFLNNISSGSDPEPTRDAAIRVLPPPSTSEAEINTLSQLTPVNPPSATAFIVAPPPELGTNDALFVSVTALRRTWMRLVVDGIVEYEGLLLPGVGYEKTARDNFQIRVSNAAGVRLMINQQEYPLGAPGELADRTFTLAGLATPTLGPTNTQTLTLAPSLTLTLAASITATLTSTASLTAPAVSDSSLPTQATSPTATSVLPSSPTAFVPATSVRETWTPTLNLPSTTPTPTATSTSPQPTTPPSSTPTLTRVPPSATASPAVSFTPSPFLPPRLTRTPSNK